MAKTELGTVFGIFCTSQCVIDASTHEGGRIGRVVVVRSSDGRVQCTKRGCMWQLFLVGYSQRLIGCQIGGLVYHGWSLEALACLGRQLVLEVATSHMFQSVWRHAVGRACMMLLCCDFRLRPLNILSYLLASRCILDHDWVVHYIRGADSIQHCHSALVALHLQFRLGVHGSYTSV